MIKAVIFDYGGVVKKETDPLVHLDIAKSCHISLKTTKKTIEELKELYETGKIDDNKFWKIFKEKTNTRLPKDYKQLWLRKYIEKGKKDPKILELISKLKTKKYIVAILSNTIPPHVNLNKKEHNFDLFDPVILSTAVGLRKPNKKIYLLLLKKIKLKPKECIFVDDKEKNLKPAKQLGIHTILFRNSSQLEKKLKKLGVKL